MNQLKLVIRDTQRYETHEDMNEEIVEAVVAIKGESSYITFKQEDKNFNTMITTLIKVKKGVMTVKRTGGIQSEIIFDVLKPHEMMYTTPMGQMHIEFETHELETRIEEDKVTLKVRYSIIMQGAKTSENLYFIQNV